jgi:predicted GNAT family acetyltransferase
MMALAERARPGPFGARTAELGDFLGIRDGGALVAMIGQRLRLERMIEVSAVATDPDHLGRGHGARLTAAMVGLIRARGSIPILHVRESNRRAVTLYERGGFATRRRVEYVVVEAAGP